jgi:hypothetical protein
MANEAWINKGTALLFNGEGTANVDIGAEGLQVSSTTPGRVSAQHDLGAAPRAAEFSWSCKVQWQATPTQYGTLDLYIAGAPDSDSTQIDGDVGSIDANLGDVDQLQNLKYIGSVVVEDAATTVMVASGVFTHTERYLSLVVSNNGGATLNGTAANFRFDLTPQYWQGQ